MRDALGELLGLLTCLETRSLRIRGKRFHAKALRKEKQKAQRLALLNVS